MVRYTFRLKNGTTRTFTKRAAASAFMKKSLGKAALKHGHSAGYCTKHSRTPYSMGAVRSRGRSRSASVARASGRPRILSSSRITRPRIVRITQRARPARRAKGGYRFVNWTKAAHRRHYSSRSRTYSRGRGTVSHRSLARDARVKARHVRRPGSATWRGDVRGGRV
jgi:hypothetical protein